MAEPTSDRHYEDKFEFPLLRLIKKRAEEEDISYADAATEVIPEYTKTIRYRDTEYTDAEIRKRQEEMIAERAYHKVSREKTKGA